MTSSPQRILYADDDIELREIIRDQLIAGGYVVDEAADGQTAMDLLGRSDYDLALLDISMPGKTGIDVLKFIREKGLRCKVIMLTGTVGFSPAIDSVLLGAEDYIAKPYTVDYLLASIKRVLEKDTPKRR